MRIRASCPPSRLYVKSGWPSPLLSSPGAFWTQSVCAWTSIRNAPGPNAADASTIPLDSHAPRFPGGRPSTSVGPVGPSADWSTLATTSGVPENGTYQRRAVVALGSVEPNGNCWLDPGSSVTTRPVVVDSRLSG